MQLRPFAADHASRVEGKVDAAVTESADRGHREKARAAIVGGEIGAIGECEAKPDDEPAHGSARISIGRSQPPEERGRSVSAANDRLPQREEERAKKRADNKRAAIEKSGRAGHA